MTLLDLFSGAVVLVLFPVLMVILMRLIAPRRDDLETVLGLPATLEWPRGIREEEPVRWRLELLSRRADQPRTGTAEAPVQANAMGARELSANTRGV